MRKEAAGNLGTTDKRAECQNLQRHLESSGTSPGWQVWEQAILPSVQAPLSAFLLFEFIIFALGLFLAALDSLNISSWTPQGLLKCEVHPSPADVPLPLPLL